MNDSPETSRSLIGRAWSGFWKTIDGVRRVVVNLLFLFVLYLLFLLFFAGGDEYVIEQGTALVLNPAGVIVEEYSGDPFDRALQQATDSRQTETRLRDMVAAVERAAEDDRISALVIRPDHLWGVGLASLLELDAAVAQFREAGKPVIGVASGLGQHGYYLAAMADEVWLHPHGLLWLDGYSTYRNYYKNGLDQLEVEINLFRAGEYKSAMEPYVRNDMSPEAREANLFWIGNLWEQYLEGVSRYRGIPIETLSRAINELPDRVEDADGDFASLALDIGLVDRLLSEPEVRQQLALQGVQKRSGDRLREVGFLEYLEGTNPYVLPNGGSSVAVVVGEGEILYGDQPPGVVGSISMADRLRQAGRDENVAAVVLRVDSPGGDAFASETIRAELQALRERGKTVVVSMGDVAASGGYWISMAADEVWASPATITGSIGVYGMIPTFGATLDKVGITADGVGTTPIAGKFRIDMPLDEGIRRIMQSSTENTYERFVELVSTERGMPEQAVRSVAEGRVWSGTQAAQRGLVDRLGTFEDAVDSAARIAGLGEDYDVRWIEPELTAFEQFLLDMTGDFSVSLESVTGPQTLVRSSLLQRVLDDLRRIMATEDRFSIAAHCLCGIE